ncbi:Teichuronic acid biosynthesis protein TuaB [Tsuneonella dongtanensis]|uniref:Teichuronic acid biosynthesis protein TuaB n=1 Tax=Tsuneonella dongtanensis TaxID=692370 RepID=A0A1B2AGY3_9SPHN|nr:lipopolysaccharide biosynthesis protein [Tsuneonella dongtanensis]ANY21404.1 Teichuronic acid biosynthesis protein TuaB [Tsuneonella dongtanensis]
MSVTNPAPATTEVQPRPASGLAERVRSALAWRWGTQVLAQAITWASTILVVRLLVPADYGLYAMTQAVVTALAFLNGQSFATSLIQTDRLDERRIGQVFGMLLLLNGSLALAQVLLAPYAARYYGEPLVADMLRVQAFIFLTIPFAALPQELLARRIEFRSQGLVNLGCAVVGATTALVLAWQGFGVWALVWAPVAMFTTRAIGMTLAARLLVRPVFDFRGAGDLFTFGGALTLCQFLWIVQSQADIVIAGRSFEPHELGLYAEALFLTLIITGRFLPPINEVAFPTYSELYKTRQPLGPFFLRIQRMVALVVMPAYLGLALVSGPAVLTLFGEKWAEMAPIAGGLALAMPAFALQIVCSPATNGMGRPQTYMATNGAGAVLFPFLFLVGVEAGPWGLVAAWWIGAPALLVFTWSLTLPQIGVRWRDLARALAPAILSTAIMVAVVTAARAALPAMPPPAELAVLASIGAATYLAALVLIARDTVGEIIAFLTRRELSPA